MTIATRGATMGNMRYDPNYDPVSGRHFDPESGRPLPRPQWWVGTKDLRTEAQWEYHLRKGKEGYGRAILTMILVGLFCFAAWPAPGFGQGVAILLWVLSLGALPWWWVYRQYYNQYFHDWGGR